jgi:chemotaxis protein CheC
MTIRTPEQIELNLLQQLFTAATADASSAMCRWTSGLITLTLDEIREVPLEAVSSEFNCGDELLTMVVLTLAGEVGGTMILTFDEVNGRELAAALLGRSTGVPGTPWSELEKSALNETGNILGCAYMNALTRLISTELVPSPPYFLQDYGASVLQQAVLQQAIDCDQATICRTTFHREGRELNWNVLFVPTAGLRHKLADALTTNN